MAPNNKIHHPLPLLLLALLPTAAEAFTTGNGRRLHDSERKTAEVENGDGRSRKAEAEEEDDVDHGGNDESNVAVGISGGGTNGGTGGGVIRFRGSVVNAMNSIASGQEKQEEMATATRKSEGDVKGEEIRNEEEGAQEYPALSRNEGEEDPTPTLYDADTGGVVGEVGGGGGADANSAEDGGPSSSLASSEALTVPSEISPMSTSSVPETKEGVVGEEEEEEVQEEQNEEVAEEVVGGEVGTDGEEGESNEKGGEENRPLEEEAGSREGSDGEPEEEELGLDKSEDRDVVSSAGGEGEPWQQPNDGPMEDGADGAGVDVNAAEKSDGGVVDGPNVGEEAVVDVDTDVDIDADIEAETGVDSDGDAEATSEEEVDKEFSSPLHVEDEDDGEKSLPSPPFSSEVKEGYKIFVKPQDVDRASYEGDDYVEAEEIAHRQPIQMSPDCGRFFESSGESSSSSSFLSIAQCRLGTSAHSHPLAFSSAVFVALVLCYFCVRIRWMSSHSNVSSKRRRDGYGEYSVLGGHEFLNGTFSDDVSFGGVDSDEDDSDEDDDSHCYGSDDDDDEGGYNIEIGKIHESDTNGGLTLEEING